MKKFYLLVCLLWLANLGFGQISKGKNFWFGLAKNYYTDTARVFVTTDIPTTGWISIAGLGWSQTFSVTPGISTQIDLPLPNSVCSSSDAITSQGIHLVTTECVSVFSYNFGYATADASIIAPINSIGSDYILNTYRESSTTGYSGPTELLVVGNYPGTSVTITPTAAAGSHPAGAPFTITLDSGQTYFLQSSGDLTGTRISGNNNQNFSVFASNECTTVGGDCCCDHLYEQMSPVTNLGTEYVMVPYSVPQIDHIRIVAVQNATQIVINGGAPITRNAGQFYDFTSSTVNYITSNNPISIEHIMGSAYTGGGSNSLGDPFMIVQSPTSQRINTITFPTLPLTGTTTKYWFLNLIVKTSDIPNVTLDGGPIAGGLFTPVAQNNIYSTAHIPIAFGDHTINSSEGVIGYVYGYTNDFESFGYQAGVKVVIPHLSIYDATHIICPGDYVPMTLNSPDTARIIYNEWDFGDGSAHVFNTFYTGHTYNNYGDYPVTLIYELQSACKRDTLVIDTVKVRGPNVQINGPTQFCVPTTGVVLTATSQFAVSGIVWSNGATTNSITVNVPNDTVFTITASNSTCYGYDTAYLFVAHDTAGFTANNTCEGVVTVFNNTSQTAAVNTYTWHWDFGDGQTSTLPSPTHQYAAAGTYAVKMYFTNNIGCGDSITHTVTITAKPVAGFTYNHLCNASVLTPVNTSTLSVGTMSYSWNFADGSPLDNSANPSHTYTQSGLYVVKLVVSSGSSCADSTLGWVNVILGADMAFTGTNTCLGGTSNFTDLSVNNSGSAVLNYTWDFGDGNTSTSANPSHTYAAAGNYNVTLTYDYGSSCTENVIQTVHVNPSPAADFTAADLCNTGSLTPTNNTTISSGTATYTWDFGDGTATATGSAPSHTYAQSGNYNIQLIAVSDSSCADTVVKPIRVIRGTNIDFSAPAVCAGAASQFTDLTTNPYATTINGYTWDFGDGNTGNTQNTTHTYAAFGNYNVELKLDYGNGCMDSLTKQVVVNEVPVAAFTVADLCNDSTVHPVNTSTYSAAAPTFSWTFGDGTAAVTGNAPAHTYALSNNYTIQLIATSAAGCADTTTNPVNVIRGTLLNFTAPAVCAGNTSIFTDQTTNPYNTTINGYSWDFGDGGTAATQNATHTYATYGTYNAQLQLDYGNGCTANLIKTVTVNEVPVAAFTVADLCNDSTVHPQNTSTFVSGAATYSWTFGDGSAAVTGNAPAHTYAFSNNYTVELIASSAAGCADTATNPVNVIRGTLINFSAPSVCAGLPSQFSNSTQNPYTTTINSYAWDFGDAGSSNQQNPTHTYAAFGTYNVTLVLDYGSSCADSLTKVINVNEVPTAAFTVADLCNDSVAAPVDNSTSSSALNYNWLFGDGTSAVTGAAPTHTYALSNTYTVQLIVSTASGCADTASNPIRVIKGTYPNFSAPAVCEGTSNSFTNQTTNPYNTSITGYSWDFGDAATATQQNTTHTYAAAGSYSALLVLDYGFNCADSVRKTVIVNPNPVAAFSTDSVCSGSTTHFTDGTTPAGLATSWAWNFGDAATGNTQNPTHTYAAAGNYNAQLIATSANGCSDTVVNTVNVKVIPPALFTATNACLNTANTFTNTTNTGTYPVNNFVWLFGDNTAPDNNTNTTHTYATAGNYTVTLIADFANGCPDTTQQQVTVYNLPAVSGVTTNISCFGGSDGSVDLTPTAGQTPFSYSWNTGGTAEDPSGMPANTYTVNFTDAHTCTGSATYTLTEPTQLTNASAFTDITCFGYSDGSITISPAGGTPAYSYVWSNGSNGATAQQLAAGNYSCTVTDAKGCTVVEQLTLNDPPKFTVYLNPVDTVKLGQTVTLTPTTANGNPVSWQWLPGNFLSCDNCQEPEAGPVNNYIYQVTVVDDKGCIDTASVFVFVNSETKVFIPNAFTPNGDGTNDYFEVFGNKEAWKQFDVQIFDRIGEKVYESTDMDFKWDGTYKGTRLNPAVFVYLVRVVYLNNVTEKLLKGSVTLMR
ncbi:MAG: PKD domain-containing protein [Chitinophagales bacterium]